MSPLTAIVVAQMINRIRYTITTAIGAFFLGLGEFTAGWSTKSVPAMFATQGFLFGIGTSLIFLSAATVPSLQFSSLRQRNRGLTTEVVYGGTGVGSAVIALSLDKMIAVPGLETSPKILGASTWTICLPASYFLKPRSGRGRAVFQGAMDSFPIRVGIRFLTSLLRRLFRSLKFIIMLLMSAIATATFPLVVPPFLPPLYISSIALLSQAGAAISASWELGLGRRPYWHGQGLGVEFVLADCLLEAYGGAQGGITAFRPAFFHAVSLTIASASLVLVLRLMMNRNLLARV
ncbi:hypothetical protein jhhlp_007941 [Lomentospora prolificans]|uniref:Major facilitator superfamily (MFS) profile domain-containing protein n=1 Tax=Lomentospora prolificans TaxID=41688 RepID=A0A2N3N109_9PEZI|nr:hypothetical protein jhhlp_007941 [Lomentospora prolificans]